MNLDSSNALSQGISAQNNGQFQEAARLYRVVLSSEPNNSDAYHIDDNTYGNQTYNKVKPWYI